MSILNIAFNGKELFDWEGDNAAVASLDQEVRGMAKRGNTDPMVLWQSELLHIVKNDGRFFTPNPQVEMMIVIWGLLMGETRHPDHPGVFADYIDLWNFDFDILIDPDDSERFTIDVKGGFTAEGTA